MSALSYWTLRAHAQSEQRVVQVAMADGSPLDAALYATMRELAARLGLGVVDAASAPERPWASVRFTPAADGGMGIKVEGDEADETVYRHVGPADSEEMKRETIAHVVLGILEPRVHAERAREAPEAKSEPEPEQPAIRERESAPVLSTSTPAPRAAHRLRARASFAAGPLWLERKRVAARAELAFGVVSDRRLTPSLAVGLGAAWRPAVERRGVEARVALPMLRLRAGVTPVHVGRFALEVALGGGADFAFARFDGGPRVSTSRSRRVDPTLGPLLTAALRLSPALDLTASFGLDVDFTPRRWLVARGRETEVLIALERLRPHASLGVAWTRRKHAEVSR